MHLSLVAISVQVRICKNNYNHKCFRQLLGALFFQHQLMTSSLRLQALKKTNQHPNPPVHELQSHIQRYWEMRKPDTKILALLLKHHIDQSKYLWISVHSAGSILRCAAELPVISIKKFRRTRESLDFYRSRSQGHTPVTIREAMVRLRHQYPKAGSREIEMVSLLFHEEKLGVPRSVIVEYFQLYEVELVVEGRRASAADVWAMDQHVDCALNTPRSSST
ncbi:hypothetical protein GGX14DRAFT_397359 [Mycena pura]|uniref:Uncharacterized protein n=1 Tax=Mycena pura TaxID=153505 RepID=A0AAD6V9P1_9AGAR|nr:hypothetical protein GGX14DRAFT_397359 [Mycena pura]